MANNSKHINSMDLALHTAESAIGVARKTSAKFKVNAADFGHPESLRYGILSTVTEDNYDRALKLLEEYLQSKEEFPNFKERAERYFQYCGDLINGIRAKKSFPGMNLLAMSKQQELFEKSMHHFEDLKVTLKKIEQIEREVRLEDLRSTVWVVKALVYCVFAFLAVAFLLEISKGVMGATGVVIESTTTDISDWVFNKIGM